MPDTTELFRHDVPVLRTSLARHGLVDVSTSPTTRRPRPSTRPPSSEDLSAADRGEEQWGGAAGAVGGAANAGTGTGTGGAGAGFQALVGVDSVVVGHVRAAEELRATLLYTPAPKNSLKTQELATTWRTPRDDQLTSIQTRGGQRLRERHGSGSGSGSSGTFSSPPPPASLTRQRAGSTASFAAASAMAAVRKGDRPFYLGAARLASRGGGASLKQAPQPTSGVSMANLLDIAVSLFGGAGSRGTKTNSMSNGADGKRNIGEKLVTFTVDVHTGSSKTLGVAVKELGGGAVYVEDVRKLAKGCSGPAELAGILIGDVILGINYKPLEKGLVHTSSLLAEAISLAGFVKLQISRAVRSNGWRPALPWKDCPIVTELMWRIAQLRKAGILNSAERHATAELVLQRMAWEEGTLAEPPRAQAPFSSPAALPMDSAASDLLDALVLRVKGLREAISVRCVFARSTIETVEVPSVWGPPSSSGEESSPSLSSSSSSSSSSAVATSATAAAARKASAAPGTLVTVRYVMRVEDIGTGREWLVFPQYSDFSELRQQLLLMWPPIADLPFPAKRPVPRVVAHATGSTAGAAGRAREAVLEDGVVRLEAFLEGAMALLGIYVSIDPRCSGVLRLIQDFLGRPKDLVDDEVALSPALCDQKRAELLLYKLLNQVDSPAARLKILLMRDFENEVALAPDMQSLMKGASSRLRRLQDFVLEQHEELLSSSSYATGEEKEATTRKAVRRQVELSFYLPLRRCLWKELTRRLQGPARKLSRAIKVLRCSSPSVFGVESTEVLCSKEWGPAKESMGQATRRVLPTDQIDGLHRAAEHIAALHASLQQTARDVSDRHDVSERNASNGIMSVDTERACCGVHNQSESEGEKEGEEEDAGVVMVCDEGEDGADASCGDGPLPTGEDASGRRERDSNNRLLPTTAKSTGPATATNGTREICENDTRGTGDGDGDGEVTDATASDPREPKCNLEVPSAEGEHEEIADGGDDDDDDGVGGPETTALAALSLINDSIRRAELSRNEDVAGTEGEGHSACEASLRSELNGIGSPGRVWRASASASASPGKEHLASSETSPASSADSTGTVAVGNYDDREQDGGDEVRDEVGGEVGEQVAAAVKTGTDEAMGADDFLPLFALALVHSAPLDLLVPQTLLTHLMDADGSLSEAGYLVATLEAAVSFIAQVYASTCCPDDKREMEIHL